MDIPNNQVSFRERPKNTNKTNPTIRKMGQSISESDDFAPPFNLHRQQQQGSSAVTDSGSSEQQKPLQLFVIGTTGSGKTTLLRHWGLINDNSFLIPKDELQKKRRSDNASKCTPEHSSCVNENNGQSMDAIHPVWAILLISLRHVISTLIRKHQEQSDVKFHDRKCLRMVKKMDDKGSDVTRNNVFVKLLFQLAKDPSTIQLFQLCQSESILQDGFEHILRNIDHYESILTTQLGSYPSVSDVLYTIHRSNSWSQPSVYHYENLQFSCTDYGHCPSVRKRFASEIRNLICDANIYVFCAGITDYYKTGFNDASQSAISESLHLFEEFENRQCFRDVPFIFVLTKIAMLEQTLKQYPLALYFPNEYHQQNPSSNETEEAIKFISELYLSRASHRDRITVVQVDLIDQVSVKHLLSTISRTVKRQMSVR